MQTTLKRNVAFAGMGLHSGRPARLLLRPAPAGHGIVFRRTDRGGAEIAARYDAVVDTRLNTRLGNTEGETVSTVEHLMAALAGVGIHNAAIDIDGPEIPIMDGSSRRFVAGLLAAGIQTLHAPLEVWRVARPVEVTDGPARAALVPHAGFEIAFEIDFPVPAIGHQTRTLDLANGSFVRELADCRTFCLRAEVEAMQAAGLALGGTLDNAVVVDDARVLNPEGFRRADECVRHKMLDAVGDLALAGLPIVGRYEGVRAGHGLTNRLLRQAFATPGALVRVPATPALRTRLPGTAISAADLAKVG